MKALRTSPSRRATQELECLKQAIDWKVKDMESGYDILLAPLDTDDQNYIRLNAAVEQTIARHVTMVELLGAPQAPQLEPAAAPAQVGGDQVKLKEGLNPTLLMLNFNPQNSKHGRTSPVSTTGLPECTPQMQKNNVDTSTHASWSTCWQLSPETPGRGKHLPRGGPRRRSMLLQTCKGVQEEIPPLYKMLQVVYDETTKKARQCCTTSTPPGGP